jgi:ABC-type multidrug transport system ATPase subunit
MTVITDKTRVTVSFQNITFSVAEKKEPKHIVNGVSGVVNGGEMLCVLGPSGSGKTSLIQIIAQRLINGGKHTIGGQIFCNGKSLTPTQFQRISGLVTQEDVFNATLTVQESLAFGAKLRLRTNHKQRVKDVISMLNLGGCASTKVGDDSNIYLKGISGGEKRRLAIASEILDPDISVIVLDEPTSGLDAAAALNVVKILRQLSDAGMTVITTLHQPRSSIMALFQQLMVLSQGRRVFYGQVNDYIPYLTDSLHFEIPVHESPYDLLLDVLNPSIGGSGMQMGMMWSESADLSAALADAFEKSELASTKDAEVSRLAEGGGLESALAACSGRRVGWWTQFTTVLFRTLLIKLRDPAAMSTQMGNAVFMGLLFGAIYWCTYDKAPEYALLDAQMTVTITVVMGAFMPFDVVLTFPVERRIFLRERNAGLYCSSALFFGRVLSDIPQHILAGATLALIIYPMAGLRMGLGLWVLVNVGGILVGAAIMQAAGALSRTFEEANMMVMVILMMSMVLSSAFVREPPVWFEWAREISVMGLLGDICTYLEFRDVEGLNFEGINSMEDMASATGLLLTSEEDMIHAIQILVIIFFIARFVTYLGVKFLYTGKSFRENLRA